MFNQYVSTESPLHMDFTVAVMEFIGTHDEGCLDMYRFLLGNGQ